MTLRGGCGGGAVRGAGGAKTVSARGAGSVLRGAVVACVERDRAGGAQNARGSRARWCGAARVALAAVAPALPFAARAQERPVGPTVRALAALPATARMRLVGDSVASRLAAVTRDPDGVPVAHVLVRLRTGDPGPLLRAGARLGTRVGTLVSAHVPLASLQGLLTDGDVAAVYGARRWAPLNDLGTTAIGVASLRRLVSPDHFSGPVGRGVIVGLVDTGLDFTHEDFLVDSLGRSRVLYLWDQMLGGSGPGLVGTSSFSYGVECRQEDLSTALCPSRETDGHGTHVLGTAAGDGSATGAGLPAGQFAGVAPGADLIVVRTNFFSDGVVDGVNYIFSRAAQLGRPAVVNLSLGSQWGPHDGTLPEEEALDSLVGPGRIVVAAAGNDGDNRNTSPTFFAVRRHGSAAVPAPGAPPADFTLSVPSYGAAPGSDNDLILLQLWYAASDTVSVTVLRPDGTSFSSGSTGSPAVTQDGSRGQIHIESGSGQGMGIALTPDNVSLIVLGDLGGGTAPANGTWTIRVTGVAAHSARPMHLWVADGALGAFGAFSAVGLVSGSTNGYLVGSPATATRVLSVGAYVTRLQWFNPSGPRSFPYQERPGDLATFSSPGPRRDGVMKPDITAPGKGVVSAMSHFAQIFGTYVMPDLQHFVDQGTSMATPFVTGAVALLLERRPDLTPEEARIRLTDSARVDSFALHPFDGGANGTPNASWGYGKLWVPAALGSLVQLAALRPGQASDAIGGRFVPSGEFRVLHLLVIGDPDSTTVLDSLALRAAGSVNEGAALAGLKVYRDAGMTGAVPASGAPLATAALTGDNPRVMLRVGPDTIPPHDTLSLVVTTQLASGVTIPSGQTVRFDVAADSDLFFHYMAGTLVAAQGIPYRGPLVTLQALGVLGIRALPLGSAGAPQPSARSSRFPVLRAELAASTEEPFVVQQVGLKVAGSDPSATLRVLLDLNHNGAVDEAEPVLADTTVALKGDSVLVTATPENLVVPAGSSVQLLVDLTTSGGAPNGAQFGGAIEPSLVHTRALYSGLPDRQAVQGALSSGSVTTSLLAAAEQLNLSENPVRGASVIINFAGTPRSVAIYSFTGQRVRAFAAPASGNVVWDLTTDDGRQVVNGVYIVVIDLGGSVVRRRLYVARRTGP